jgi:uridine kinase
MRTKSSVKYRECGPEGRAAAAQDDMRAGSGNIVYTGYSTITKRTYPIDDAVELFRRQGMEDKVKLFHYRRSSTINVYNCEGYSDYFYGYMFPNTKYIHWFDVLAYNSGIVLVLPTMENPCGLEPFVDQHNLFDTLSLSTDWGDKVDIETVGDLNDQICGGRISDMILVQEALQERRIGDIAEMIYDRGQVKFVLIAGPSSSGKTTFAHRLAIQLRSFGLVPHIISLDNYFVDRAKMKVDIDGNYDFECLEALDVEQFNDDMNDLLDGETVEMPTFNFKSGKREYKGNTLKLGENDILVMEGIHCLDPKLTPDLADENKFRIYTSALTSLNIDEHNRIPSTDARLLRRMVRDARTRGYSAQETIRAWKKVREGEEQYIFPYQDDADVTFNSVLIYELAVLKQFAEPQLFRVGRESRSTMRQSGFSSSWITLSVSTQQPFRRIPSAVSLWAAGASRCKVEEALLQLRKFSFDKFMSA